MKITKRIIKTSLVVLVLIAFGCTNKQTTYKGYPLIKATNNLVDVKINDFLIFGNWEFTPDFEITSDIANTIEIPFLKSEEITINTDIDSINILLNSEKANRFFILNDTVYSLITVQGKKIKVDTLRFNTNSRNSEITFWYEQNDNNRYLDQLRSKYPIDSLIQGAKTDMDKTLAIMDWVHNQWRHDGNNEPQQNDAISILEEAKNGKNFRCVEYGIVASACLNAVGLKARTIGLKTKNVETTEYGAGHVATEVFLNDLKKWAFIDVQFNSMPVLDGIPLNAVEFQQAINDNVDQIEIKTPDKLLPTSLYMGWIYPYLYYFDVYFDNREGIESRQLIDGESSLMLVPVGAKQPKVFQIKYPMDNLKYTHSLADFYAKPD